MNTRYLEEFLVFSDLLNWTVAAERLYTTRPTLVDHMHALEAELECTLIVSEQGRPALTPAGRRFTRTSKELLEQWDAARNELSEMADNLLVLKVASSSLPWLESLLYKSRRAIRQLCPYKRIEISAQSGARSTVEALRAGQSDIVVAGYKSPLSPEERPLPDDLCAVRLGVETVRLFMTQDNPLSGKTEPCAADLDGGTIVLPPDAYRTWQRDEMSERFARHGAQVTLRTLEFDNYTEYFAFEFGDMFGAVPTTLVPRYGIDTREEFRTFTLADMPIESVYSALTTRAFAETENGALLLEELRRAAGAAEAAKAPGDAEA